MTAPPTAATTPLTPGPVPPPVDGAPTGRPALVDPEVPTPLGVGLAVPVGLLVPDAVAVGDPDAEPVGVEVAEQEAVALADELAEAEELADADVLGVAEAELEALLVGVQLVEGVGVQEGEGEGFAVPDMDGVAKGEEEAEADELGVAEAVAVAQLDVDAEATPPHDPAKAAIAAETSRVVVPSARPI